MLCVYQLPVILSVRYGIDIWIWLRAVFGGRGVMVMTAVIILINYPWYAVCADLFAASMMRLAALLGVELPGGVHPVLGLACVLLGTLLALRGPGAMTKVTRVLVPLLLAVGVLVVIVGFRAVPFQVIWNYRPTAQNGFAYLISIEANFAFVITLVGGMAGVPRLTRSERSGFWAGVLGQGAAGSFFVVVRAVMAIATGHVAGQLVEDPTLMLAVLAAPAMALCSLLLVAFANIGTQAVGAHLYGVMLKSAFRTAGYRVILLILTVYACGLVLWGGVVDYFGSFLTLSASIYAPLAALLFTDFFLVRRQKLALRSAYGLPGYTAYRYTGGFNWVGLVCVAAGVVLPADRLSGHPEIRQRPGSGAQHPPVHGPGRHSGTLSRGPVRQCGHQFSSAPLHRQADPVPEGAGCHHQHEGQLPPVPHLEPEKTEGGPAGGRRTAAADSGGDRNAALGDHPTDRGGGLHL